MVNINFTWIGSLWKVFGLIKKFALVMAALLIALSVFVPQTALAASSVQRYQILMRGDRDGYVLAMQKALFDKGFLKLKPTGYFGTDTQDAVLKFQVAHHLTADGKAGPVTLKLIMGKSYVPLPATRKVVDAQADAVRPGDKGDDVKALQKRLKDLGYYKYKTITGFFGPMTVDALKNFQKSNGLPATGVAAEKTLGVVYTSKVVKADGKKIQPAYVAKVDTLVTTAEKYLGKRYAHGGNGPTSFDCSGYTTFLLKKMGMTVPRTANAQSLNSQWTKVTKSQLRKGDLVFFDTQDGSPPVGHVGIYIGGGRFIHCQPTGGVSISDLTKGYYSDNFKWGRRIYK